MKHVKFLEFKFVSCSSSQTQNPSDYYLEHNGKYLDLITSLSFYVISTNDCIELKALDQTYYSKKARIGIQYEDNNSSVFHCLVVLPIETIYCNNKVTKDCI